MNWVFLDDNNQYACIDVSRALSISISPHLALVSSVHKRPCNRSGCDCSILLRYVLSVTFCGAVVMKVMDQKTLVKRRWSYKVRITLYILTLSEFARHEFTNLWLETLPDTLSLSLTGIRLGPKEARRMNNSTASLSPAERWTITEIRWPSNWLIPCSQMSFCYKV